MTSTNHLHSDTLARILRACEMSPLPNADIARSYNLSIAQLERLMKKHGVKRPLRHSLRRKKQ